MSLGCIGTLWQPRIIDGEDVGGSFWLKEIFPKGFLWFWGGKGLKIMGATLSWALKSPHQSALLLLSEILHGLWPLPPSLILSSPQPSLFPTFWPPLASKIHRLILPQDLCTCHSFCLESTSSISTHWPLLSINSEVACSRDHLQSMSFSIDTFPLYFLFCGIWNYLHKCVACVFFSPHWNTNSLRAGIFVLFTAVSSGLEQYLVSNECSFVAFTTGVLIECSK